MKSTSVLYLYDNFIFYQAGDSFSESKRFQKKKVKQNAVHNNTKIAFQFLDAIVKNKKLIFILHY